MTMIISMEALKAEREQWFADQAELQDQIARLSSSIGYRIEQTIRRWFGL